MAIGKILGTVLGGPLGFAFGSQYDEGKKAAEAQGQIAQAQLQTAREGLDYAKQSRDLALKHAMPTAQELANIQKMIQTQDLFLGEQLANLEKEQALLDAVDPALREAGQQALQLLQGQEAKALDPIRKNRDIQRRALENQLAQRLGPGFRTSSAGIEALNAFDLQTSNLLFDAQQTTMGTLLNVSMQVRPNMVGNTAAVMQSVGNLQGNAANAMGNIQNRAINAINATPVNFSDVINNSGAQYAGDLAKSNMKNQFWGNLGNLGVSVATMGAGSFIQGQAQGAAMANSMKDIMGSQQNFSTGSVPTSNMADANEFDWRA